MVESSFITKEKKEAANRSSKKSCLKYSSCLSHWRIQVHMR